MLSVSIIVHLVESYDNNAKDNLYKGQLTKIIYKE